MGNGIVAQSEESITVMRKTIRRHPEVTAKDLYPWWGKR